MLPPFIVHPLVYTLRSEGGQRGMKNLRQPMAGQCLRVRVLRQTNLKTTIEIEVLLGRGILENREDARYHASSHFRISFAA